MKIFAPMVAALLQACTLAVIASQTSGKGDENGLPAHVIGARSANATGSGIFGTGSFRESVSLTADRPLSAFVSIVKLPLMKHFAIQYWFYQQASTYFSQADSSDQLPPRNAQSPGGFEEIEEGNPAVAFSSLLGERLFSVLLCITVGILFYHQKQITGTKANADPTKVMNSGHFSCHEDLHVCMWALCCPALRWADTVNMSGTARGVQVLSLTTFWTFVLCFLTSTLLDLFFAVLCALLLTHRRQKLRELMEAPHGDCPTLTLDFLFALCCPCCLITQEARVVNEMSLVGKLVMVDDEKKGPDYASAAA